MRAINLKWREIATYLLLYKTFNNERVEYFTLLAFLKLFYSKRNARRELKRLINLGLIRKVNMELEVISLDEFFKSKVFPYIIKRLQRRLRNIDKKSRITITNNSVRIVCYNSECIEYIERHKDELSYFPLEIKTELAK